MAALAAAGAMAARAPSAIADGASLRITSGTGESDPVAGLPRVFTVSGTTVAAEHVWVKSRPSGGAPCAPSAQADTGRIVSESEQNLAWGTEVNGAFSLSRAITWEPPGAQLFCIWIENDSTAPGLVIPQPVTFRAPGGTISASISPPTPISGQLATVAVSGSSEAQASVFAKVQPAGGACAPSFDSDAGQSLIAYQPASGAFASQGTAVEAAGEYQLCAWLSASAYSAPAIAAQSVLFSVVSAPPPTPPPSVPVVAPAPAPACVVPAIGSRMRLAEVERRLRAAHCRVGRVAYRHSRRVRRGRVLALTPRPHTQLSHGAKVAILASLGRKRLSSLRLQRGGRLGAPDEL